MSVKTGGCDLPVVDQSANDNIERKKACVCLPVQVVLSSTVRQESIRINQVHKVCQQVVCVAVELGLEETFHDPEGIPVVDLYEKQVSRISTEEREMRGRAYLGNDRRGQRCCCSAG